MTINFKSFFVLISAFLINVQFAASVEPAHSEYFFYSEQVTEPTLLAKQENAVLFAQLLINEIVTKDGFQNSAFIGHLFNQAHVKRSEYQLLQRLVFIQQRYVWLSLTADNFLATRLPSLFLAESDTPNISQLS